MTFPRETHCYLIEPVSEVDHAQILMARRFLNFIYKIRCSKKIAIRSLLRSVELDTRSVTGHNLRCLLLKTGVHQVQSLKPSNVSVKYRDKPKDDEFRVEFIKEIIEARNTSH